MEVQESLNKLIAFVEKEQFKGYDPYDTLNSSWPFHWLGKWGPVLAIQFQKRNPINIRGLLGIKKGFNPKAMGLFLQAYSNLYLMDPKEEYREKMQYFFNWLTENYTKGYSGYCWGYNFDWASPVKFLKKYSPTIVVSGFVAKGIHQYYMATKDPKAVEVLISIGEFVEKDLEWTKDETGICISYSTVETDCCYNASMLGAELYARLYDITKQEQYKDWAIALTNFTVIRQKDDGRWNYSIDLSTGKEREQIDFHQGYVLDSIHYVLQYTGSNTNFEKALLKGSDYYYNNQFYKDGRSIWRVPTQWPVEIHNQSQGIITFSRLNSLSENYPLFAREIANWTINNMQDPKGYFYYKKYPAYKIKTPFIRWSQAWMFLAITELIKKEKNQ